MHILRRVEESLDAGLRDPELLYCGARYAVSLRLPQEARRFLDPLSKMLHRDGKPTPAFFPVGLLCLQVFEDGKELATVRAELAELAEGDALLERALVLQSSDPAKLPAGSPHALLSLLASERVGDYSAEEGILSDVSRLSREAEAAYRQGDLKVARSAMESVLLVDGDQPDVLRNLVTIASEQQDVQAYLGYWRRFVKVLFWRVMRGDRAESALRDLTRFYCSVAAASEREFNDATPKIRDRLPRPGLLPRWLESHAALVWLERNDGLSVADQHPAYIGSKPVGFDLFWFRVFYPEFAPFVEAATNSSDHALKWSGKTRNGLPFDPRERMLTRFAEWSKLQFSLGAKSEEHVDTVSALAGFVARIPPGQHVKKLQKVLADGRIDPAPFRRAWRESCSLPLHAKAHALLRDGKDGDHDWPALVSFLSDTAAISSLSPALRMMFAFALCRTEREDEGLNIACDTYPDMTAEDWEDKNTQAFWTNVVRASLSRAASAGSGADDAVEAILERIRGLPDSTELPEAKKEALKEAEEAVRQIRLREEIDGAIEASKSLVQQGDFEMARRRIRRLPDSPKEVAELKSKLLGQIGQAEEQAREGARIKEMVDDALEQTKELVGEGDFGGARRVIRDLPDSPADLTKLKGSLLRQIDEAEGQAGESRRINQMVEKAIEKSKDLVAKDDFSGARREICKLPDSPDELSKLKSNLSGQIDKAEKQARDGKRINAMIEEAIRETKKLVEKSDFSGARSVIRRLPDSPTEVSKLKKNLLQQIDDAEQQSREGSRINAMVEEAVSKSKSLVQKGQYKEARRIVERLPSSPAELSKLKSNLIGQINDVERQAENAQTENNEMLKKLASKNVDMSKLGEIARDNDVDMSNPMQFNAFLKAVLKQV